MCEECIEQVAYSIGSFLDTGGIPSDIAFSALHMLARLLEEQTDMSLQDIFALQTKGRELGGAIIAEAAAEESEAEESEAEESEAEESEAEELTEVEYRSLLADATLKHHRGKPD